ncbi:MAG TPA: patatin-like phospholipase family protein [Alphaproteobacteria bacterium]|nr:patatin-like phospholipase family protein [Alphaproteobacteria bacterium]
MDSAPLSEPTAHAGTGTRAEVEVKKINLALQGGGAHGAFAWGVLDRLLEDERIEIEGISATSAGAMNATVLTYGYAAGGRTGARKALEGFWRRVAHIAALSPFQATWLDRLMGNKSLENSPAFLWLEMMTRMASPYQLNPVNYNPLRDALEQSVDFDTLRTEHLPIRLYLSATNVRSGKVKIFCGNDVTADAVMASGCLPFLFQAVEIDGEHYWDGGYMGNPAIYPLIYHCDSRDVVVVHTNPLHRDQVPTTAGEIMNRVNEISFNSSLMREMRAIGFVTRLIDEGKMQVDGMKRMLIHAISAEDVMGRLGVLSKLNADWEFLAELKESGRAHADAWLASNYESLGRESTIDIAKAYL